MSSYTVLPGDTLESISRRVYGTEEYATNILKSNPGLTSTLTEGINIITPIIPGLSSAISGFTDTESNSPEEVAVLIDGVRFRYWTSVSISLALDTVASVDFSAPFDPGVKYDRSIFTPFSFKTIEITVGGALLFTGTMVIIDPQVTDQGKTISVSGYALPGVLNDCTASAGDYPIEYNGLKIDDITKSIIEPFGLSAVFPDDVGDKYDRVSANVGDKLMGFLSKIAKERKMIISSTEAGELLFQKALTDGEPVTRLVQGLSPVSSVSASFNPQEYFSHITGVSPTDIGSEGNQYTVKNDWLDGVLRPYTYKAEDTKTGTLKESVESKAGRMFGNMVTYTVEVSTWLDEGGNLWTPNTFVNLLAPDAMVYYEYKFLISAVKFDADKDKRTATLSLVLPGSFSGEIPEALPWVE